jgi:hypothetical protein
MASDFDNSHQSSHLPRHRSWWPSAEAAAGAATPDSSHPIPNGHHKPADQEEEDLLALLLPSSPPPPPPPPPPPLTTVAASTPTADVSAATAGAAGTARHAEQHQLGVNNLEQQAQSAPFVTAPAESMAPELGSHLSTDASTSSVPQQGAALQQPAASEAAQEGTPEVSPFCVTVVLTGECRGWPGVCAVFRSPAQPANWACSAAGMSCTSTPAELLHPALTGLASIPDP